MHCKRRGASCFGALASVVHTYPKNPAQKSSRIEITFIAPVQRLLSNSEFLRSLSLAARSCYSHKSKKQFQSLTPSLRTSLATARTRSRFISSGK